MSIELIYQIIYCHFNAGNLGDIKPTISLNYIR